MSRSMSVLKSFHCSCLCALAEETLLLRVQMAAIQTIHTCRSTAAGKTIPLAGTPRFSPTTSAMDLQPRACFRVGKYLEVVVLMN